MSTEAASLTQVIWYWLYTELLAHPDHEAQGVSEGSLGLCSKGNQTSDYIPSLATLGARKQAAVMEQEKESYACPGELMLV